MAKPTVRATEETARALHEIARAWSELARLGVPTVPGQMPQLPALCPGAGGRQGVAEGGRVELAYDPEEPVATMVRPVAGDGRQALLGPTRGRAGSRGAPGGRRRKRGGDREDDSLSHKMSAILRHPGRDHPGGLFLGKDGTVPLARMADELGVRPGRIWHVAKTSAGSSGRLRFAVGRRGGAGMVVVCARYGHSARLQQGPPDLVDVQDPDGESGGAGAGEVVRAPALRKGQEGRKAHLVAKAAAAAKEELQSEYSYSECSGSRSVSSDRGRPPPGAWRSGKPGESPVRAASADVVLSKPSAGTRPAAKARRVR